MAYNPATDFFGLMRLNAGAITPARAPGLDIVVAALARAGLFKLHVGQSPPLSDQDTTVWLLPAEPSWTAEGTVWLWDAISQQYLAATPELWDALFVTTTAGSFQKVTGAANTVAAATTLLAIQRIGPTATALALPSVAQRAGTPLQIVDWSTSVFADHTITITPDGTETIMQRPSWQAVSTSEVLTGLTLYPSIDLDGWVIAP